MKGQRPSVKEYLSWAKHRQALYIEALGAGDHFWQNNAPDDVLEAYDTLVIRTADWIRSEEEGS